MADVMDSRRLRDTASLLLQLLTNTMLGQLMNNQEGLNSRENRKRLVVAVTMRFRGVALLFQVSDALCETFPPFTPFFLAAEKITNHGAGELAKQAHRLYRRMHGIMGGVV